MKVWEQGEGNSFQNSEGCVGESFAVDGAPLDIALITITARYPENGYLYNATSHEMAYVVSGEGYIESSNGTKTKLSAGSVIYFSPNERVAWYSSNMTLVMPCAPAFNPKQHFIEETK